MHDALLLIGPSNCIDGDIRLVGEKNETEGRVEICYSGVWGTVCADNGWDEVDANVVCRQLGLSYQPPLSTSDSTGEGLVLLENITCNQSDSNISQCVDFRLTGTRHVCKLIAEVMCTDAKSTSMERVSTTIYTNSISSSGSGPIFGSLGALVIIGVIAVVAIVVTVVVIMRKRVGQTENR